MTEDHTTSRRQMFTYAPSSAPFAVRAHTLARQAHSANHRHPTRDSPDACHDPHTREHSQTEPDDRNQERPEHDVVIPVMGHAPNATATPTPVWIVLVPALGTLQRAVEVLEVVAALLACEHGRHIAPDDGPAMRECGHCGLVPPVAIAIGVAPFDFLQKCVEALILFGHVHPVCGTVQAEREPDLVDHEQVALVRSNPPHLLSADGSRCTAGFTDGEAVIGECEDVTYSAALGSGHV